MNIPSKKTSGRVFVFERTELVLLFFFFIVMTVTSFILGMRLGKKQTMELAANVSSTIPHPALPSDNIHPVELKSQKEEQLEDVPAGEEHDSHVAKEKNESKDTGHKTEHAAESQKADSEPSSANKDDIDETTFKKLQDEFEKVSAKNIEDEKEATEPSTSKLNEPEAKKKSDTILAPESAEKGVNKDKAFLTPDPSFIGKYTIQLGSYKTLSDAQTFAEGFLTKGYRPLINEVDVKSKTWYRVSLGVFESSKAAKQYVDNEKELFGKQKFVISEIQ
ncbi:MAG: SPOR domain-containing protein [Bacteriovoracaceae bacterium]|nr:SPOR domain-containing protein [Bacteriovoracaceae bacterium]